MHGTHDVSRLLGRRLGALLSVDAYKIGQGGTAGEQRGDVAAEEGQQHLFKQQRNRHTFDTADCGMRKLQRGGMTTNEQVDICGGNACIQKYGHPHLNIW